MSEPVLNPGDAWVDKFGERRTIVRIDRLPNYSAPGKVRRRVVYLGADRVETSCRRENFRKWIRRGGAAVVESEGAK